MRNQVATQIIFKEKMECGILYRTKFMKNLRLHILHSPPTPVPISKVSQMKEERKLAIATAFSPLFEESVVAIPISLRQFTQLQKGIYATSTEEKWNLFLLDSFLYCARSWTDTCIFKVEFSKQEHQVLFHTLHVTRDTERYTGTNLESDIQTFKRLLRMRLGVK